jgi:hypothetical protein
MPVVGFLFGGPMWDMLEKIEDELTKNLNKTVRFSKESFYSGEERLLYKRLTIDDVPAGIKINIMDLQKGERPVRVENKVASIMKMLQFTKGA